MESTSRVPPHQMKSSHPDDFEPKVVFFYKPPSESEKTSEWADCFQMKAAAVYSAISGTEADNKTILVASKLLISIASFCKTKQQEKAAKETVEVEVASKSITTRDKAAKEAAEAEAALKSITTRDKAAKEAAEVEATLKSMITQDDIKNGVEPLPAAVKERIDAVYFLVGFLRDLKERVEAEKWDREKVHNSVTSRHGAKAVSDMVKLENQLPLILLKDVISNFSDAKGIVTTRCKEFIEDQNLFGTIKKAMEGFKLNLEDFPKIAHVFCWYYSPFYSKQTSLRAEFLKDFNNKINLLDCLHHSLVVDSGTTTTREYSATRHSGPTPTAKHLVKSGAHFQPTDKGSVGVNFDDSKRVVQLPIIAFDRKLETVVWNLLAWEWWNGEKPVTRHFQLMNELINDVRDVRVMKKQGILKGRWRNNEEIVEFAKKMDGHGSYPSICPAMDSEINKMKEFYETRMKKFLVRNQPAVLWVSSVAAASLLVTAIFAAKRSR